jgi:hypothetical protein
MLCLDSILWLKVVSAKSEMATEEGSCLGGLT